MNIGLSVLQNSISAACYNISFRSQMLDVNFMIVLVLVIIGLVLSISLNIYQHLLYIFHLGFSMSPWVYLFSKLFSFYLCLSAVVGVLQAYFSRYFDNY